MKKILLSFLLLPFYCTAQLEVGVNGGITPYHIVPYYQPAPVFTPSKFGPIYDISLSYKISNLKFGLGYNSSSLYFNDPNISVRQYYARPMTDLYFFMDYEHRFFRSAFYIGASAGVTSVKNSNYLFTSASAIGTSYGLHGGYSYNIFKGLWANVQVGIIYVDNIFQKGDKMTGYTPPPNESKIITYPITLGIHYKMRIKKHKIQGIM